MKTSFLGGKRRERKRQEFLFKVRKAMVAYWKSNGLSRRSMIITDLTFKKKERGIIEITLTAENLGPIIGIAGKHIDGLTLALRKALDKNVSIILFEDKTWRF